MFAAKVVVALLQQKFRIYFQCCMVLLCCFQRFSHGCDELISHTGSKCHRHSRRLKTTHLKEVPQGSAFHVRRSHSRQVFVPHYRSPKGSFQSFVACIQQCKESVQVDYVGRRREWSCYVLGHIYLSILSLHPSITDHPRWECKTRYQQQIS